MIKFLFLSSLLISTSARAWDLIDLSEIAKEFSLRSLGYRTYRVDVSQKDSHRCVLSLTAHVKPPSAEALVLFHGIGESRFTWEKLIKSYQNGPYAKSFVAIDYPRHGDSNCEHVKTFDEIAKKIRISLETLKRKPQLIIGSSLGSLTAGYLQTHYPNTPQIWIAPPVLESEYLAKLMRDILDLDTPLEAQVFLNKVLSKPRDFPEPVLKGIVARLQRASALLTPVDINKIKTQLLALPAEQITLVKGVADKLAPPERWDPKFSKHFNRQKTLGCGHDITYACISDLKKHVLSDFLNEP